MKLEDIELQLGDILTFEDGVVDYVSIDPFADKTDINFWAKNKIVKIQRYEKYSYLDDNYVQRYYLKTIYERKEILDKEELQKQLNEIQSQVDKFNNEIRTYYGKIISTRDRVGNLKKQVSELQKKLNKEEVGI